MRLSTESSNPPQLNLNQSKKSRKNSNLNYLEGFQFDIFEGHNENKKTDKTKNNDTSHKNIGKQLNIESAESRDTERKNSPKDTKFCKNESGNNISFGKSNYNIPNNSNKENCQQNNLQNEQDNSETNEIQNINPLNKIHPQQKISEINVKNMIEDEKDKYIIVEEVNKKENTNFQSKENPFKNSKSEYIPDTLNPAMAKISKTLTDRLKRIQQKNSANNKNNSLGSSEEEKKQNKWQQIESKINSNKYRPIEPNHSIYRKAKLLQEQMLNAGNKDSTEPNKSNISTSEVTEIINKKPVVHQKKKKKMLPKIILN